MEQELTAGLTGPSPGDMNAEVAELLAAAMETDEPANATAAPETTEAPAPAHATDDNGTTGPKSTSKLSKNFALSDKLLFPTFSPQEEENMFFVRKNKAANSKTEDGFEIVDNEEAAAPAASPFVAAAIATSHRSTTENMAPTFSSSGDARIDFFFHVLEQTNEEKAVEMLANSWTTNDLHTLKLVASLRDIKEGKGIRRQYQYCLYWLYKNHPKTLYENLPVLIQLGYWKDALHFLMTILFNGFVHPYFGTDDGVKDLSNIRERKPRGTAAARGGGRGRGQGGRGRILHGRVNRPAAAATKSTKRKLGPRQRDDEKRIYNTKILQHYKIVENILQVPAREMAALRLRFARERFASDPRYRAFHIKIAQIFAAQLQLDFAELGKLGQAGSGDEKQSPKLNLSLVGKWTPTLEGHFDRYTLVASSIALEFAKLLKKDDILSKSSIPVAVYLARKFYNKSACIPLRTQLEIPERAMSKGEWDKVNYKRIPAKCMKLNKAHFIKHDQERFEAYLKKDDTKVAGATLKPIELIRSAMAITPMVPEAERIVIEKQWQSLADDVKSKGGALLSDAIAVCDVSGSMQGDPMTAAIGLTLLTMNMCSAPWNEICITFHEQPKMHHVPTNLGLVEKVESMRKMPWGGNTNLQAVFKQIINIGIKNNLTASQMPKVLLVYTDMEFDQAFAGNNQTNYELAKTQFQEKGYTLPTIVFWNLRDAPAKTSTPVRVDERGTVLLSGWSGQLLAFIMSQKDLAACSPWSFVQDLIDKKKYAELKVYD